MLEPVGVADLLPLLCDEPAGASCGVSRICAEDAALLARLAAANASCAGAAPCRFCLHKGLFPLAQADLLLSAALFAAGTLAGAAGIGGGGVNVPALLLLGGFAIEEAVPVSHLIVLGNALAQNAVNLPRSHPSGRGPLVDFGVPLLLLPPQLSGDVLGLRLRVPSCW